MKYTTVKIEVKIAKGMGQLLYGMASEISTVVCRIKWTRLYGFADDAKFTRRLTDIISLLNNYYRRNRKEKRSAESDEVLDEVGS